MRSYALSSLYVYIYKYNREGLVLVQRMFITNNHFFFKMILLIIKYYFFEVCKLR